MQRRRQQEGAKHRRARRETAQQQATRDRRDGNHDLLLTYWMQFDSLNVDYGEFTARLYDLLAEGAGLLHGRAAPVMSLGAAGYRGPLA